MTTLALELSSAVGSIAWCGASPNEQFQTRFANDRKHSGAFFENLESCLKRFGRPNRIVVGLGPGSYAGTRIAIATATGLAAATAAELLGAPSLRAIDTDAEDYVLIGDARRHSFFFARVSGRRCLEGPVLLTEEELRGRLREATCPILTSEPLAAFPEVEVRYPSALILAGLEICLYS